MTRVAVAVLLGLAAALAACGRGPADGGPVRVVASVYPLAEIANRVGGDLVSVRNLLPAGAEPHDAELSPAQVDRMEDADVVLYVGEGFQPAVEEVAERVGGNAHDVFGLTVGGDRRDPHFWLDPRRLRAAVDLTETILASEVPGKRKEFATNAESYRRELDALDAEMESKLATCDRRSIVTAHDAFGYLAKRFDLEVHAISGLAPEAEPDPKRLAELADLIAEKGITTVFFETLASPEVAETLAREAGVRAAVLDPIEGKPRSGDYIAAMRANLAALVDALGCR